MNAAYPFLAMTEVVKLYLVASYTFLPLDKPLHLLPVSMTLLAGLVLGRVLRATGGRLVYHVLANAIGLSASFLATLTVYRGLPFMPGTILPVNDRELAVFLLVLAWIAVFWFRGLWLGTCGKGPRFCVARFDEGVAAFLFLLSLAALMRVDNPAAGRLVLPFFLFSSIALGMCRVDGVRRGGLIRRSRRLLVIPFASVLLLGSAAMFSIAPLLFDPAARLGTSIRNAYSDFEPHLVRFLRWLFGFYTLPTASGSGTPRNAGEAVPITNIDDPRVDILVTVLVWLLGIIAAAVIAILAAYGMYWLARRLITKVERRGRGLALPRPIAWLRALIRGLGHALQRVWAYLKQRRLQRSSAVSAYTRLLRCGRVLGTGRKANETPREYARRLSGIFPRSAADSSFVVDALEREVYGLQLADFDTGRRLDAIRRKTRMSAFLAERISSGLHSAMETIRTITRIHS
jgi:hypothetical protein